MKLHGHSARSGASQTYKAWQYMKTRCRNPNRGDFYLYGGRGISVSDRWVNSFPSFLEDMGECPDGLTLERLDPNGNYEPGNCKWATPEEQANNKRNNIWVTYKGRTLNTAQWAREIGVHPVVFRERFQSWGVIDRLFTVSGAEERLCLNCGSSFQTLQVRVRFCSRKCRCAFTYLERKKIKGQA